MMDYGHTVTDEELKKLEKKLAKEYNQAYKEMQAKAQAYFDTFKKQDAEKLRLLNANKITEAEYLKWRQNKMLTGERYNELVDTLAKDLTNTNQIAMSMLSDNVKDAYALNRNFAGYEIAKGLNENISWDLVDHNTVERLIKENPKLLPKPRVDIPRDMRWNQQKIRSAITQGILQGESIDKIADRLKSVTDMSDSAAVRNARTATTGAENAGRQDGYNEAVQMGIDLKKKWISTLDSRTRETHILLDGEEVPNDEAFSNRLMYPGDPNGEPEEVYNCRCTMIAVIGKHKYDESHRANKLGDMTYEEWKNQNTHGAIIGATGKNYTWSQSMDMQRMLQNAPEDIRELWKENQGDLRETVHEKGDGAYYSPSEDRVHLNESKVAEGDKLSPEYETHFHEYGHNIDYNAGDGKPISAAYRDAQGRSFEDIITQEWEAKMQGDGTEAMMESFLGNLDTANGGMGGQGWLRSGLSDWRRNAGSAFDEERYWSLRDAIRGFSADDKEGMLNFLQKNIDIFNNGSYTLSDAKLKENILAYCTKMKQDYPLEVRGNLSDMFERYTVKHAGIAYPLGAGHGKTYAQGKDNLAVESFAEMFASEVSNPKSLELIKKELPESYKAFKDIVKGALKK